MYGCGRREVARMESRQAELQPRPTLTFSNFQRALRLAELLYCFQELLTPSLFQGFPCKGEQWGRGECSFNRISLLSMLGQEKLRLSRVTCLVCNTGLPVVTGSGLCSGLCRMTSFVKGLPTPTSPLLPRLCLPLLCCCVWSLPLLSC